MSVKFGAYSLWCFAKFVVGFSFILAMSLPRQNKIQSAQTESQCQICYNRSLTDTDTFYEFAVCHGSINQDGPNLITDKKGWSVTASSVRTYKVVVAVLYPFLIIGSMVFLCLGCIAVQAGEDFQGQVAVVYALLFVQVNFYQSFGIMVLSNFIWALYPSDGCYVSPIGVPLTTAQYVLIFIYIGFATIEGCCNGCFKNKIKNVASFFNIFVLIGYSIVSVIIAVIYFQKSRDPTPLILVILALASVFEVPAALLGYSVITHLLGGSPAVGSFPLRIPSIRGGRPNPQARAQQPFGTAPTTATTTNTGGDDDDTNQNSKEKEEEHTASKFRFPQNNLSLNTKSGSVEIEVDELRTKKKTGVEERDEEERDEEVTRVRGIDSKKLSVEPKEKEQNEEEPAGGKKRRKSSKKGQGKGKRAAGKDTGTSTGGDVDVAP